MMYETEIHVTVTTPGFHFWVDAPESVKFLRNLHRHEFTIQLDLPVEHHDRDLEFFLTQEKMWSFLNTNQDYKRMACVDGINFGGRSCEMIAQEFLGMFPDAVSCSVWEDMENGATVRRS